MLQLEMPGLGGKLKNDLIFPIYAFLVCFLINFHLFLYYNCVFIHFLHLFLSFCARLGAVTGKL